MFNYNLIVIELYYYIKHNKISILKIWYDDWCNTIYITSNLVGLCQIQCFGGNEITLVFCWSWPKGPFSAVGSETEKKRLQKQHIFCQVHVCNRIVWKHPQKHEYL